MKFLALSAVASVASGAFAQTTSDQLYTGPVKSVRPNKAIQILEWAREGNKIHILKTGRVVDMSGDFRPASTSTALAWDGIEADPAGLATGFTPYSNPAYGGDCTSVTTQASRFFSGDLVNDGGFMQDFTCLPGTAGKLTQRIGTEFYLNTLPVIVNQVGQIVFMSENVVTGPSAVDPNQAANRADIGTVWLFTYTAGALSNGFAYIGDLDFGAQHTNGFQMPADGNGAMTSIVGDYDGTNLNLGCGQNMRWVNKLGNPTVADNGFIWRDRLVFNGSWDGVWNGNNLSTNNEYEPRVTTACPGVVKNSVMAGTPYTRLCVDICYTPAAILAPTSLGSSGLGVIVSGDVNSLAADDANALKICKGFVPTLSSPKIRFDANFTSPYLTPSSVTMNVKAAMASAGVFKIRGFVADVVTGGVGTFTYGNPNKVINDTTINTTQTLFSGPSTNVVNNVDPTTGAMQTRVEIQQTGFSAVTVPCTNFEMLTLAVSP